MSVGEPHFVMNRTVMLERSKKLLPKEEHYKLKHRHTGRSLSKAFWYLSECIAEPEKSMIVRDHHGTLQADKMLLETIRQIVRDLDLDGFYFRRSPRPQVVFSLKLDKFKKWTTH